MYREQARRNQRQVQLQEWSDQQVNCTEQIAQAESDLESTAARTEEGRAQVDDAQAKLPSIETQLRSAAASRDEMRSVLALVEQDLALVAQAQRDAARQMQALAWRRARWEQELRDLNDREPANTNS